MAGVEDISHILAVVRSRGEEGADPLALWPEPTRSPGPSGPGEIRYIGGLDDLSEAIRVHRIDEVIFSGRDVAASDIIASMATAAESGAAFRIAWTDGGAWVGPGGPLTDSLTGLQRAVHLPAGRRAKRTFDVACALVFVLFTPVLWATQRLAWSAAAVDVLRGSATWVGYAGTGEGLPAFRRAVLPRARGEEDRIASRLDVHYARDYRWLTDFRVVLDALISHPRIPHHGHI